LADLAPLEIGALARIVDELDYYQLMDLDRSATAAELRKAYHARSRTFHPDANHQAEAQLLRDCTRISKRLTEAYCVLRDPRRRKVYDEHLAAGGGTRMQLSEAKAAHAKQDSEELQGKTAQGRQYFSKATTDLLKSDYSAAVRNLQMALTFEPGNQWFEEKLAEARQLKKELDKEKG
jgi:DnaJ-class molecular chaperone